MIKITVLTNSMMILWIFFVLVVAVGYDAIYSRCLYSSENICLGNVMQTHGNQPTFLVAFW